MAIQVACPHCGRVYHTDEPEIDCSCGKRITICDGLPRVDDAPARPQEQSEPLARPRMQWSALVPLALGLIAGALAAAASSAGVDLSARLWIPRPPAIPAWSWLLPPVAGVAAAYVIPPRPRRMDNVAIALTAGTAIELAIVLLISRVFAAKMPPGLISQLQWHTAWILIGGIVGLSSLAILRSVLPPFRISRAVISLTGLAAGSVFFGIAYALPELAYITSVMIDVELLPALGLLCGVIGAVTAAAAYDLSIRCNAGGLPVLGAIIGLFGGAMATPALPLYGTWLLIGITALPLAGAFVGIAAGLAAGAEGRLRRRTMLPLAGATAVLLIVVALQHPSPETLRLRPLIEQARIGPDSGEALEAIASIRDPLAVPALCGMLQDENRHVVSAAARALGNIGDRRAVPALLTALDDGGQPGWKYEIVTALAQIGDERALPVFLKMIEAESGQIAEHGIRGLRGLGDVAIEPLLKHSRSADGALRARAIRALRTSTEHPAVRVAIAEAIDDREAEVRVAALGSINSREFGHLYEKIVALTEDDDRVIRHRAISALAELEDPRAVPILSAAMSITSGLTGRQAAIGLGRIGTPEAVACLERALDVSDIAVGENAVWGMAHVSGERSYEAILRFLVRSVASTDSHDAVNVLSGMDDIPLAPLLDLMGHESFTVRERAGLVLANQCRGKPELIEPLLQDKRAVARLAALRVLGDERVGARPEPIAPLIADADERVREAAASLLAELGPASVSPLVARLGSPDHDAEAAAELLGSIGDARAVPALLKALHNGRRELAAAAAVALGRIGDSRAIGPLIEVLGTGRAPVRRAAAEGLGAMKDAAAVDALVLALSDSDHGVREAAITALVAIGAPAIDRLGESARSSDSVIRAAARNALSRIDDPRAKELLKEADRPSEPPDDWIPGPRRMPGLSR